MELYNSDDIVALATPPGTGALAIVRFSGNSLQKLYEKFSHKKPKNRAAVFTKIYHPNNNTVLDHAIIIFFQAPNSFTGEDIIEITCHGGRIIYQSIIDAAIDSGVRVAGPGEFSLRAFLNDKMDLVQAESIISLIGSNSRVTAGQSLHHLDGRASQVFIQLKESAIDMLSIIENELNFSEEDINFISIKDIKKTLLEIREKLNEILIGSTFGEGRGGENRVVILGRSNSGKSSLFNAILGYNRAIVSSSPGTTRDTVESYLEINGITICLIDTAGFWESDEYIDQISIKKTSLELEKSNLCLIVDENNPRKLIKSKFFEKIDSPYILIQSKCDNARLYNKSKRQKEIHMLSSKNGYGIDGLLTMISTLLRSNIINDPNLISSISRRQRALLKDGLNMIESAIKDVDSGAKADIIASILHGFVLAMRDVLGEITSKDVLHNIFASYCIGK